MILFQCDYNEGAHPRIMEKLIQTNLVQTVGYGEDEYCEEARNLIRQKCQDNSLKVEFLVGGTQANITVIDSGLRSYQGVLSASSGHINVHETGAVESCGHKVLPLESEDGKIRAAQIEEACISHKKNPSFEHTVQPKMVYLSNPTELGTIYSKKELKEIAAVCRKYNLYLFLDGARLGYGLAAPDNDLDFPTIAECADVFYIGGTKVGALFGEAVVIRNEELKRDFRYFIKQKGGMLAKGRLLGVQFAELFRDGLYEEISAHAIEQAERLRAAFDKKGYSYLVLNRTNQIFPILPNQQLEVLSKEFGFNLEKEVDDKHSAVRFCTSWATKPENVDKLIEALEHLEQ